MLEASIDVVIPHYNSTSIIERLLKSIPREAWIQLLVVDDHSDESERNKLIEILSRYPNAKFFEVPVGKKGPGNARNVGIQEGKGEWVLFADCDDYFSEHASTYLNSIRYAAEDVVYFTPDSRVEETAEPGIRHQHYQSLFDSYASSSDPQVFFKFYAPWSKLIKRNLLEGHSIFFDDGVGGEDNNFSLKVAFFSKEILVENKVLYYVTESNASLTGHMSPPVLRNHFNAMSRYNDFLQHNELSDYQAPMLGWVLKARKLGVVIMLKWFFICLKKGYPISPYHYIKPKLLSLFNS